MTAIELKLDALWRKLIYALAGKRCEMCGNPHGNEAHHVFGRRAHSTRWYIPNGVCLCADCHAKAHRAGGRTWLDKKLQKQRGEDWYQKLRFRFLRIQKPNYERIADYLVGWVKILKQPEYEERIEAERRADEGY
jgi:hypothetical protein